MELNKKKIGDEDVSTYFSWKGYMSCCSPLWACWLPCFALLSLVFNSILPARASWSSRINPHPSCTFHLLHPPLHPSHIPSLRSQVLQDADVQFGMLSASSKIPLLLGIVFLRFYPQHTSTSSVRPWTTLFSMGYGDVSALSELVELAPNFFLLQCQPSWRENKSFLSKVTTCQSEKTLFKSSANATHLITSLFHYRTSVFCSFSILSGMLSVCHCRSYVVFSKKNILGVN